MKQNIRGVNRIEDHLQNMTPKQREDFMIY